MSNIRVKIKKLSSNAAVPRKAYDNDAGFDLTATSMGNDAAGNLVYGTGLAIMLPIGYVGLIFPRSSVSNKDLILSNSVGVLDSGYSGEVTIKFRSTSDDINSNIYDVGDRVAQLVIMPIPEVELDVVERLELAPRGEGGYGSTGT